MTMVFFLKTTKNQEETLPDPGEHIAIIWQLTFI